MNHPSSRDQTCMAPPPHNFLPENVCRACSLWRAWHVLLRVILPEQNSRPNELMTSKKTGTLPNKPQQTAFCNHSVPLIWRSWDEINLLFPLFSFALFYFPVQHLLICLFPLLLSRCIKWGALFLWHWAAPKSAVCEESFSLPASHLLSFASPHLLYSTFFLSLYPSPSPLLLLTRSLALLNMKQRAQTSHLSEFINTSPSISFCASLFQPIVCLAIRLIMLSHLCN